MNILILWINLPTKSMINSIQSIIDETSIPVFKKKIIYDVNIFLSKKVECVIL